MSSSTPQIEKGLNAAVILAALATIPLVVVQERGSTTTVVAIADWTFWAVFLIEYVVLIFLAADRRAYAKANWCSVGVIVLSFPSLPTLLSLIRVVRVVRVFRLLRIVGVSARALPALQAIFGRRGVQYVASLAIFMVVVGGGLFDVVEEGSSGFWNGVWWAIVTPTTVGYGDIAPMTVEGRLIGVALMLTGIGLVATIAASIAAYFADSDDSEDLKHIEERLERIEGLIR